MRPYLPGKAWIQGIKIMRNVRLVSWGWASLWLLALGMATPLHAQNADLFVTAAAPGTANVGDNITFTVNVGNAGNGTGLNDTAADASLTDTLPGGATFVSATQTAGPPFSCTTPLVGASGGTLTCTIAPYGAGASNFATFQIVVKVSAGAAGTNLINSVTINSSTPDPNPENNTSASGTSISGGNLADVGVNKTGPASAAPGSNITYAITVSNFGPNDAASVTLNDPLGAGLTFVSFTQTSGPTFSCPGNTTPCTIATLPNGSVATFNLVATVSSTSGTYTNTASVTSANDPNPENDSSVTAVAVSRADVGVIKSAPATAVAGGPNFNYVITLSNSGPDAAQNARFSDPLPAGVTFISLTQNSGPAAGCVTSASNVGCTISSLLNGQSAQFTITVKANANIPNGTVLSNVVTAATDSFDSNTANNSSSASTTVQNTADLSITKTGPASVAAGSNISYTVTISNAGPDVAGSPSFSDTLPIGESFVSITQNSGPFFSCTTGATVTCTGASGLATGASATFTLTAAVSGSLANGSTLSNTATASSSGAPDPVSTNNFSTSSATVSATADLAVTKTASYSGTVGGNIVYTLGVTNNGPSAASAVQLSDPLPSGTHFVSLIQSGGPAFNCTVPPTGSGGVVNCTSATLATGTTATFVLTIDTLWMPMGAQVVNTATATSTTNDPAPGNNAASAAVTLARPPPLVPAPALNWLAMLLLSSLLTAAVVCRHPNSRR